ncbi:50S ribosomal protein L28 [Thalassoglobus sp. JC818]|uniref:50S ribosomal protein L28 n=1 Tax=Thalassoglobus sp. JC818 TaxID=3232136 RepID=UPI00345B214B
MSTLKKNKRAKLAKKHKAYGENKPALGNSLSQRGKAKYLGGNGRKTTGITRRKFKKNLQRIRVIEDGKVVRRRVPVSLIRSGMVERPVVREPFTVDQVEADKKK